jgi:hypothetical protein
VWELNSPGSIRASAWCAPPQFDTEPPIKGTPAKARPFILAGKGSVAAPRETMTAYLRPGESQADGRLGQTCDWAVILAVGCHLFNVGSGALGRVELGVLIASTQAHCKFCTRLSQKGDNRKTGMHKITHGKGLVIA